MLRRSLLSLALLVSAFSSSGGQSLAQLPRATVATGMNDSTLVYVSDSAKRSRAAVGLDFRKFLSLRAFDSLVTANLRLTSAVTGSATWASTQTFASGQRVDSATGAARASALVGSPAITVSSCVGCAPAVVDSATGAARAQILTTSRTLWGQSFNGSANVTAAPTFGAGATVSSGQALTLTGATITGAPTWSSVQTFAATQRVDSATGAARASALVGSPAITVSSCTGCGGGATVSDTIRNVTFDSVRAVRVRADTVRARAGASQRLVLQTTTSGSVLTTAMRFNERQQAILPGAGSASSPTLAVGDTVSGIFGTGGFVRLAGASAQLLAASQTTVYSNSKFTTENGSATTPAFGFENDQNNGMYLFGADTLAFTSGGVASMGIRGGASPTWFGGTGNLTIRSGIGNNLSVLVQATNGSGTASTVLNASATTVNMNGATTGAMAQVFQSGDGVVGTPAFAFQGETNTGWYKGSAGQMKLALSGTNSFHFQSNQLSNLGNVATFFITAGGGNSNRLALQTTTSAGSATTAVRYNELQQSLTGNGSNTNPVWSFSSDTTMGFYRSNQLLGYVRSGTTYWELDGSGNVTQVGNIIASSSTPIFRSGNGSAATPSFDFNGSTGLGIYRSSADTMGVSAFGERAFRMTKAVVSDGMSVVIGEGGLRLLGGTSSNLGITLQSANSSGTATTFLVGAGDTAKFGGHIIATGLTTEPSTQSALCIANGGGQVYINAAATCTVSSARFKKNIEPLSLADATRIGFALRPVTFDYRLDGSRAIGLVAEQADSVDRRLATRDPEGRVNSVNYEQVTVVLLALVKDQQRQLDSLKAAIRRKP